MSAAEFLIARARLWHWAAEAFGYPEAGFLASLRDPAARSELDAAGAAAGDGNLAAALATIREAVDTLDEHGPSLPEEHTHLFARQVLVSPYETSYMPSAGLERTRTMAELSGFYAAFGFQVSEARPELPDHLSAQLDFVAALLAKEAYALAQGWTSQAEVTRQARQRFTREHLGAWVPAFAARLAEHRRLAFYPAAAALVVALLADELRNS